MGELVFCSGCIPFDPKTAQVVEGGIEEQTEQALKNLQAVVEASGSELGKVAKTTVCISQSFWCRQVHSRCLLGIFKVHG